MGHAIISLLFIPLLAWWLKAEFKKDVSVATHWPYIAIALGFQLASSLLSSLYGGVLGNFLLHSIGGGVASAFFFVYLLRTFQIKSNWRLLTVMLFMFCSSLGVLNELAEYAIELKGIIIFSPDTHDTWRDLVANTTGAMVAWAFLYSFTKKSLKTGAEAK